MDNAPKIELSGSALAQGSIASRFQSQNVIDEQKARKEEEWQAAFARIGQDAPKRDEEPIHDGRTLYERLKIQEQLKTEEWDAKMKLGNQYRGLLPEEHSFLMQKAQERAEEERKRNEAENAEVTEYRERLAAKNAALAAAELPVHPAASSSTPIASASASASAKRIPPKAVKKDVKSLMKGVVVKKPKPPNTKSAPSGEKAGEKATKRPIEETDTAVEDTKKQKTG